MASIFLIIVMSFLARLSGSGFGSKWNASWAPEFAFAFAIGLANSHAFFVNGSGYIAIVFSLIVSTAISYLAMQSGTWTFLQWTKDETPNMQRGGTLKPFVDWLAGVFGYKLGDEGYSWIAAGVKGFLIGLPIGGLPLAILWPLGYELGTHMPKKYQDVCKELFSGAGAGIAILIFNEIFT